MSIKTLPSRPHNLFPLWLSLALALLWLIIWDLDVAFQDLVYGIADMGEYLSRYGAPNLSNMSSYLHLMIQTLVTAFWGTTLAFIMAATIAPYAARQLTPNPFIYRIARELLNFMRAMPDLLLALIFVSSMGLGPLPGVLALAVHTAGFLGKFFAENMERVPAGKYEALSAVGAGFTQKIVFAAWPSMLRESVGNVLYIFDRNVRMAAVLGLVGAGGIGLELHDALRLFKYNQASALIIIILLTIIVIDNLSSWIRKVLN
ncbi:MAG: phosphonate ABC transporter, permease protein PhnE [Methylococcaceae bacterium]|nr:phosphonate ABC transporter, permease protein PhnE [Methylococcaceae bacterium]MDZ4218574.1 phosphonate ABC transporter, permease protein PhnE [Methylobacter sp.]MDP2391951.1 phosphonate ABC transporter, permease protein PhnE [Methylococcaceae bacterium]MDP3018809.1 phosphonate ABC transporter, permease protein PhnE [Methylococcaceae bacterium]MDP3391371.1 phosphonate ABC transporter, permease protein PhnE [Methylococcaceae bacterium]